jgi:hypothetical protein
MNLSIKISVLAILQLLAIRTLADEPPRLDVSVADPRAPLTFIAYGVRALLNAMAWRMP